MTDGHDSAGSAAAARIPVGRLAALDIRVIASMPDCINLIDLAGSVVFMNDAGAKLMEIDDFLSISGKPWREMWPEASRHLVDNALREAGDGKTARFSAICPTAKGTLKQWDVVVSPVMSNGERIEWLLSISRDVTTERQAADMLRQREQELRALADNIAPFAWMAEPSGSVYWYNQRWYDYTGTTLEEMAGWGWQKVHHPDHLEQVVETFSRCIAKGEPWEDTFPLRGADGSYRWFLSRAMPVRDEHGTIVLWCGTNTDVTEQRSIDARLAQKARLVDLSHEAILVWDMNGGIVSWNAGCVDLYGFTAREAIGRRSHALLRTRLPVGVDEFEELLRRERKWTGELLHHAMDGREVWVESRQELMPLAGREVVLEVNRDISERKRADEVRSLLIGELNHRVKNTLAIVQSIARQTARNARDLNEFSQKFEDRLQALAGAHHVLTEANWSGALIRDVIAGQLFEASSGEGRIELDGPNAILTAPSALQLSLILHELASNARKYGALSAPLGKVTVRWQTKPGDPPRLCLVWRESSGPRVQADTRRGFGARLIERAGGQEQLRAKLHFDPDGVVCEIEADLALPGEVPTTYFNPGAPVASSLARVKPLCSDTSRNTAKRVLIIEDEPLIGMEIEQMVERAGHVPVGTATSVDQAIAAIEDGNFDLALVDGNLHGDPVDPIVAALAAKCRPFAFVTGFTKHVLPNVAPDVPVVSKPVDAKLLSAVLQKLSRRGD